jgi:phospholipid/cholesterol/gamma-HCH transport system substrate-binding protein
MSAFRAGVIGIVVLALLTYGGFTKFANPFASHFTVHAVFASANNLLPDSLVRIAGVNVGKVTGISPVPGSQAADVTMEINNNGLPLHSDATFWIRPRIFLEGNFFVDVFPGSPSAPVVSSGHTFPIQQSRDPVQLDQVLSSLQANTRSNLQILLKEYGTGVKQGGPSFASSINYWLPAYKYSGIVEHDLLGIQPHDLSQAIYQQGTVSGAFDANPPALESLITDFDATAGAFARQNLALQSAVAELPKTLQAATPAFDALNAAIPPLRTLARALVPGVQSSGPAIDASLPFVNQLRQLVQPSELRGLSHDLAGTVPSLAKLTQETIPLMRNEVRPASSCAVGQILPWSHLTINDPVLNASSGFPPHPTYQETTEILPGLAGESRNYDANGPYFRVMGEGGTFGYSLSPGMFGTAIQPLVGVQPIPPAGDQRPPLEENVPCETQQAITSLNTPSRSISSARIETPSPSPAGQALQQALHDAMTTLLGYEIKQQGFPYKFAGVTK